MTHKTVEKLLAVVGLGLFLVVGVALPLRLVRAAPPTYAGVGAPEAAVFTVALPSPTPTVTLSPGQPPTPTVTLTPQEAMSPTEVLSPTLVSTPTETFTPTPTSTSTPTLAPPPTQKPGQGGAPATTEAPPATALPTDTAAPTATPTPIAKPTVPPTPSAPPTKESPLPPEITALLGDKGPLVIGGCLVLLIFALGMLLILLAFRRKKPKPVPSPLIPPSPRPEAAPGAYLESLDTAGGPRRFALKPGGISIGRAPDNEVVITQDFPGWDTVSRHHARVYQWEGYWVVDDQGSMNGVWVSGRRTGHNILKDGWHLRIGGVGFVFHTGEAAQ